MSDALEKHLQRASARHMSDSKWRRLFQACEDYPQPIGGVQWRFIGANTAFIQDLRVLDLLEGNRFGDIHPAPYAELREIDWIFIPTSYKDPKADVVRPLPERHNDLEALHAHLAGYGRFPIEILPDGLRICGYRW